MRKGLGMNRKKILNIALRYKLYHLRRSLKKPVKGRLGGSVG